MADAVFVGGSLVAEGGHNPIEPAVAGAPVLFGPHMEDFAEIAEELIHRWGAAGLNRATPCSMLSATCCSMRRCVNRWRTLPGVRPGPSGRCPQTPGSHRHPPFREALGRITHGLAGSPLHRKLLDQRHHLLYLRSQCSLLLRPTPLRTTVILFVCPPAPGPIVLVLCLGRQLRPLATSPFSA